MKRAPLKFNLKKTGLPPGTLLSSIGKDSPQTEFCITEYNKSKHSESKTHANDPLPLGKRTSVTWVDCISPPNKDTLVKIGKRYSINDLILEDIANLGQLPKVEYSEDGVFIVLKAIAYSNEHLQIETISFYLKSNLLLSFQENSVDTFKPVKDRILQAKGSIRSRDADYLLYCLMDFIVDTYFIALKDIDSYIMALEDEVEVNRDLDMLKKIQTLNKQLSQMKRYYWYIRDVAMELKRSETALISESIDSYWGDLNDHLTHIIDINDNFKLEIQSLSERFQSIQAQRTNDIAQRLTLIAATFLPLSLITGVYGMNFQWMPELTFKYGYPIAVLGMLTIVVGSLIVFKLKKWL
jgi:magnesium transporter